MAQSCTCGGTTVLPETCKTQIRKINIQICVRAGNHQAQILKRTRRKLDRQTKRKSTCRDSHKKKGIRHHAKSRDVHLFSEQNMQNCLNIRQQWCFLCGDSEYSPHLLLSSTSSSPGLCQIAGILCRVGRWYSWSCFSGAAAICLVQIIATSHRVCPLNFGSFLEEKSHYFQENRGWWKYNLARFLLGLFEAGCEKRWTERWTPRCWSVQYILVFFVRELSCW